MEFINTEKSKKNCFIKEVIMIFGILLSILSVLALISAVFLPFALDELNKYEGGSNVQ